MKYICVCLCIVSFCFLFTGCNGDTYTATIEVVNNDTELYRLYMGTSDDLYNADTDQTNLDEGELFIESIPAGATVDEPLDLETNTSLTKDWVLEFYFEAFEVWSVVVCTQDTDADGYLFEADGTYTITIESTADISIEKNAVK